MKIQRLLIANRGEIAVRIIRACRELGVYTIAVYSEADADSMHVKMADHALCIGPAHATKSYLNIPALLSAAEVSKADAIHPGYGFLSENPRFARACEEVELLFIGPRAEHIESMGDKVQARKLALDAGVPVLPGTESLRDYQHCAAEAKAIGFPLLIKAKAGGGGRGISFIFHKDQLKHSYEKARAEARVAFGDDRVYLEKYCENPRHVEIQVLCDDSGRVLTLGERDCTVQRRHQKMIEEAPSPVLDEKLRDQMCRSAEKLCRHVKYLNAGTLEFLLGKNGQYYFMEMNTRIQVEHPVTEERYGIDLVASQIRIAQGELLSQIIRESQLSLVPRGHCIELRITAEDPVRMLPSPGTVTVFSPPLGPGVRVDTFLSSGAKVLPFYDSMVAKLIITGENRAKTIDRALRALSELQIAGIQTNVPILQAVLSSREFRSGEFDTHLIEEIRKDSH